MISVLGKHTDASALLAPPSPILNVVTLRRCCHSDLDLLELKLAVSTSSEIGAGVVVVPAEIIVK